MDNSGFDHASAGLAHFHDKVQEITRVIRHTMVRPSNVLHVTDVALLVGLHVGQVELTEGERGCLLFFDTGDLQGAKVLRLIQLWPVLVALDATSLHFGGQHDDKG